MIRVPFCGTRVRRLWRFKPSLRAWTRPQIVAFRNQLIHGYATVNVSTVWNVTQNAIPPLIEVVQTLLNALGDD